MISWLFALSLLSTSAQATSIKKMSNPEVGTLLMDVNAKAGDRVDAADALADRHAVDQVEALGNACAPRDVEDVCEHALGALEDLRDPTALHQVEAVLLREGVSDANRNKAFKILKKQAPDQAAADAPGLLSHYRQLDPGFATNLIRYLADQGLSDQQDLTVLIATDTQARRRVRLAALDAAEAFHHPRIYTAWLLLLDDTDPKLRSRAAKGLGRSGLPGEQVQPALVRTVRTDKKGGVRAAALASLRFYADASLLPMLHDEVLNEKHVIAWGHAMELLDALADQTSVQPICSLLQRHENLLADSTIRLIHALVRIGDPAAIPTLQTVARDSEEPSVRAEAQSAIDTLQGPADARQRVLLAWPVIDIEAAEATVDDAPALGVQLDENGMVIWISE